MKYTKQNKKDVILECLYRGSSVGYKNIRLWIPAFAGMTALFSLTSLDTVSAEATKQFYSENGLYSGNPEASAPMNVLQWSGSAVVLDGSYSADPKPPEGRKVFRAEELNVSFGGWGIFNVDAVGSTIAIDRDFSGYENGHLRFFLKSSRQLQLEIEYVDTSGNLNRGCLDGGVCIQLPSTNNVWREAVVPLNDIVPAINFQRIRSPFKITSPSPTVWYVDDVRWTKPLQTLHPLKVFPISPEMKANAHRQITVEGQDSNNELVIVYSTFTTIFGSGSMAPVSPERDQSGVLTAGPQSGGILGTVVADPGNLTANRQPNLEQVFTNFTVNSSWQDTQLGLLSETSPNNIQLGDDNTLKNSEMITFSEDSNVLNTLPVLSDDISNPPEGTKSVKTVLQPKTLTTQFQGWAIQWGRNNDSVQKPDSYTIDLSNYYDGSIRFWFKAPATPDLKNKLQVGIRSGNVPAGKEISKALLSAIAPANENYFDNQWHSVTIPLTMFARGRPFADIARTKILFNISIAGTIGGSPADRTFWIDNLRWDTQLASKLTRIEVIPNQAPNALLVPLGYKRLFTAKGFDVNGSQVDISPTWDFVGGNLGSLNTTVGPRTLLTASNTPANGSIRATYTNTSGEIVTGTSLVNVAAVNFTGAASIYTDQGFGGEVGISTGSKTAIGTSIQIEEVLTGGAEGSKFFRSTFTLVNTPGKTDAFAVWFVQQPVGTRYMGGYENGYLHFFVRTTADLEISIRSANVDADTNKAKVLLSEFGVPLDGNWQEVIIPLDYFGQKQTNPPLDFSQIQTFFAIGGNSVLNGAVSKQVFDVDDVRWLTTNPLTPDYKKVYAGLKLKQDRETSGLLRSADISASAFTYDQALAALAFTYHKDIPRSKKIFDVYRAKFNAGGFDGFNDAYNVSTLAPRDNNRTVGPNAWLLLSLVHYKNLTGSSDYDAMMAAVANWLRSFQTADGGVSFGKPTDPNVVKIKSTEQNMDCLMAFRAYGQTIPAGLPFMNAATAVNTWLQTKAWNTSELRFNIGTNSDGVSINTDKALDVYSFAPLVFSNYYPVVNLAEQDFVSTHNCVKTGQMVRGFDFSGGFIAPSGTPVDKDAVWLEGTAQMVLAYLQAGDQAKATIYLNELSKAVYNLSSNEQAVAYASNDGTAYSFKMNSNEAAVSSMAWFVFASEGFDPLRVFPIFSVDVKNISDNQPGTAGIRWEGVIPGSESGWKAANQYLQLNAQPISIDPWGIQIYTDNTTVPPGGQGPYPIFTDPTPCTKLQDGSDDPTTCNNLDSDPSGLLYVNNQPTSIRRLPVAWTIKDHVGPTPIAWDPTDKNNPNSFQWLSMLDKKSPAIDFDTTKPGFEGVAFSNSDPFVTLRDSTGIHVGQGPAEFFKVLQPDFVYFQSNFTDASSQATYHTTMTLEFFLE